ncbi:MAG: hypothetical protein AAGI23_12345 [Bacteroidota bacterium]
MLIKEPEKWTNKSGTKLPHKSRVIFRLMLLFSLIGSIFLFYKGVDFIKEEEDGTLTLSDERVAKLENDLAEYESAEQYALKAAVSGYYPCYSCEDQTEIFLYKGEVWRYGVTRKTQSGRYPNGLPIERLYYEVQFVGDIGACLKEEKRKIYYYALLPENTKRLPPLIRPPGNKVDH